MDSSAELTASLRSGLGLSLYEARAYLALVASGELSPSQLSRVSGVPRPRTYDVLRTLAERGFASERPGRPVRFAPIDPKYAVDSHLSALEEDRRKDFEERRKTSEKLANTLVKIFEDSRSTGLDQRVTVGSTSNTMWRQLELLKSGTTTEYVTATIHPSVPPYGLFAADAAMLERGVRIRLIRPFPSSLGRRYREWYNQLLRAGAELRTSSRPEFAFDVSDSHQAVLWLNESSAHFPTEAIWLRHTPMAGLLKRHFDRLWREAKPIDLT